MPPLRGFALAALLALAACGPPGTRGELGAGSFAYVCTRDTDPACQGAGPSFQLVPSVIALGAEFDLQYNGDVPETSSGTKLAVAIVPAARQQVERGAGGGFKVVARGEIAFLARASNGAVADFVHVHVARIGEIRTSRDGVPLTSLELAPAGSASLEARALGEDGAVLEGGLAYAWSSEDPSVVSVEAATGDDAATIRALAPGETTLRISAGEAAFDLPVTVAEAP